MRHSLVALKKLAAKSGTTLENEDQQRRPLKIIRTKTIQKPSTRSFSKTTTHMPYNRQIAIMIIGQHMP